MTDDIKEEAEQVAEVLTKSMGAGEWIKDFVKSKNPKFAGKSKEKRKEMALGAFYSKEETESVDEGMFSPPKMITGKAAKNRRDYLRDYHPRLIAAKKAAGSSKDYDYEPQRDSETNGTKPSTHKNPYSESKPKKLTLMSFKDGLKRAAERAKSKTNEEVSLDEVSQYIPEGHTDAEGTPIDVGHNVMFKRGVEQYGKIKHINSGGNATIAVYNGDTGQNEDHSVHVKKLYKEETLNKANEEVSLDEGRGRPPKEGSAAWKKRQSEGGGDSDTPGLHGQLIKHKHLQNAPPKIKFNNGEEAHISAEHRDRAIKHLEGMIGPGKNPQARDNAVKAMSRSHAGFKQAIGVESKPEEKKSAMSAQRDKPKLSLTKEESNMSQEDIVEKLQAALDAGILSQNDFDKLTQIDELANHPYPGPGSKPEKNNPTPPPSRPRADGRPAVKRFPPGHPFAGRPVDSVNFNKSVKEDSEQLAESPAAWRYSGSVGPTSNTKTHKDYTLDIDGDSELGDYHDDDLHDMLSDQNPHLKHHEVSAIVNSRGDPKTKETVEHEGKTHTHHVVNHQEPERLYDEVNYTGNPIDEKALSPKQKKIAAVAGDPGKIDAEDFKKLRKEETIAVDESNSTSDYFKHLHRIHAFGGNAAAVKKHIEKFVPTSILKSIHKNDDRSPHSDLFAKEIERRKTSDVKIQKAPPMRGHEKSTYETKYGHGMGPAWHEETTAGVAAVVAALSRNLKELK